MLSTSQVPVWPVLRNLLFASVLVLATAAGSVAPQGSAGEVDQDGEVGNANATLYIFPGHDFSANPEASLCFEALMHDEWGEYKWIPFFREVTPTSQVEEHMVPVVERNGYEFDVVPRWVWDNNDPTDPCPYGILARIVYQRRWGEIDEEGALKEYFSVPPSEAVQIHVIHVECRRSVDECRPGECLCADGSALVPEELDTTDYDAVVEYYGITEDDIMYM